jgi:HD-GYP domain-containing protein (c-di-GMP phosphodiesterase class II)
MLKKIPVSEVRLGMYLHELSGSSWIKHPFWKTKFVLQSQEDLQRLLDSPVTEVWIDAGLGLDVAPPPQAAPAIAPDLPVVPATTATPLPAPAVPSAPTSPRTRISLEKEVERSNAIKEHARVEISSLYQQARLGNAITTGHLGPLVEDISDSVLRNPGVFISLSRLKNKDDYTYLHSVTVCALMVALGRHLGLGDNELREAGMAGLLHDLGKARIPLEILNKPGKLTDEEFAIVRKHPRDGFEMLAGETQSGAQAARDVALHHHEMMNGKGYPEKLAGDQISQLARMSAVCDVYDAITSNRPYKSGWEPSESIRRMAVWSKEGHFDNRVFQAFVKSIGIYPTGSLVKLQSGRLAVVLAQHESSALTPQIKAFFSIKSNLHIVPEIIELSHPTNKERIVGRENPEDWGIKNLEELWTGVPARKA